MFTPPSASITRTNPRKFTRTKSLMVSPVASATVRTSRRGPPRPIAALILFIPKPGTRTQESLGRLITAEQRLLAPGQASADVHAGDQDVQRSARRGRGGARVHPAQARVQAARQQPA